MKLPIRSMVMTSKSRNRCAKRIQSSVLAKSDLPSTERVLRNEIHVESPVDREITKDEMKTACKERKQSE